MIILIDTSDKEKVIVSLRKTGEKEVVVTSLNKFGSQALLPLIMEALKKQQIDFKDLSGVEVNTGPGSYTGLKVGVAVANALGYALNIPVNGKKLETDLTYS